MGVYLSTKVEGSSIILTGFNKGGGGGGGGGGGNFTPHLKTNP